MLEVASQQFFFLSRLSDDILLEGGSFCELEVAINDVWKIGHASELGANLMVSGIKVLVRITVTGPEHNPPLARNVGRLVFRLKGGSARALGGK